MGIARSTFYSKKNAKPVKSKRSICDGVILDKIKEIKLTHPFWGIRRVRAWLIKRENIQISQYKVRKIMKTYDLLCDQKVYKAKRKSSHSKPKADKPNQFWGIDMTKFMVDNVGWVYLVIVLDWYTKRIVGWDISLQSKTADWKRAMDMAVNTIFTDGVRGKKLKLISDNGSQPTSKSFMQEMKHLEIKQIFTSYNNPKGNADTERMMRTIKEEVVWLNEFTSLQDAIDTISSWIDQDYNKYYVHSKLGYISPLECESHYNEGSINKVA